MRISGTEPSSVVQRLKSDAQKLPNEAKVKEKT